ncbi:DNA polymerase Y family protein [Cognatishimia sp. WU-CL00825]|uniref:Y-family DNA polymerase n=1 Tax=Cognatishimia sp. WU-CL00825 TaxID=3127658 RepID=UPI0033657165
MPRRIVSLWFPRLASDRFLRARPMDGPFVLTHRHSNTDRVYCLNDAALKQGLQAGMGYADARSFCPQLQSAPADLAADQQFLQTLARWAKRYCPWVGLDAPDGLVLDVTGATHLFGGEEALLQDMHLRLTRAGLTARTGLADTRGAAWALAHYGPGIAAVGQPLRAIGTLPVAALRLPDKPTVALQRLGLRTISDLIALPRATLTRRFDADVILRLDQALGKVPESISPLPDPPRYQMRLSLPEPIGLAADVMAGTERLLVQLCDRLKTHERGARLLQLTLRRVDQASQIVELRLARPMRNPARILPLFERGIAAADAGFGIDQLRLAALQVEPLEVRQTTHQQGAPNDRLDDLITRIGNRIGLENIQRFLPADSHIPERSFLIAPAAWSDPAKFAPPQRQRPLQLFPPEPIQGRGARPPRQFRWRRMALTAGRITGPERIAPEWWLSDENWRSGLRDYWKVETKQGRRLWLFYTPQNPGWFVQGEFA